jgi:hypothetical protein
LFELEFAIHTSGSVGGDGMRHSWIFEVLADLREYARLNGLPKLAAKTVETEAVARDEIASLPASPDGAAGDGNAGDSGA